jgi:hypothetical protein
VFVEEGVFSEIRIHDPAWFDARTPSNMRYSPPQLDAPISGGQVVTATKKPTSGLEPLTCSL